MTTTIFNVVYRDYDDTNVVYAFPNRDEANRFLSFYPEEVRNNYDIDEVEMADSETEWFPHYEGRLKRVASSSPSLRAMFTTHVRITHVDEFESKLAVFTTRTNDEKTLTDTLLYSASPYVTVSGSNKEEVEEATAKLLDDVVSLRTSVVRELHDVRRPIIWLDEEVLQELLSYITFG